MLGLFKMNSSFSILLNPELAALTDYLYKLPEPDLRYVIFMCDYNDSPYWQLPDDVRDRKARSAAYPNGEKPIDRVVIEHAMEEYRSLIWDENHEQQRMLTNKIAKMNKSLIVEESDVKIKGLLSSINLMKAEKMNLERQMQADIDQLTIKGKRSLSNIEEWQRRQKKKKEYEKI